MVIEYFFTGEETTKKPKNLNYIPFSESLTALSPEVVDAINSEVRSLFEDKRYSQEIWLETFQKKVQIPFITCDEVEFFLKNVPNSYRALYVVEKRCAEKLSFPKIAAELEVSTQCISQVYYNSIKKAAEHWIEYQTFYLLEQEYKKVYAGLPDEILQTNLKSICFSKKMINSMSFKRIYTVKDLLNTGDNIFQLRNLGTDTLMELIHICKDYLNVPFMEEYMRYKSDYTSPEKHGLQNYVKRRFLKEAHSSLLKD